MSDRINFSLAGINGRNRTFSSVNSLLEYCQTEAEFWQAAVDRFSKLGNINNLQYLNAVYGSVHFLREVASMIKNWFPLPEGREENEYFMSRAQELVRITSQLPNRWIPSDEPFVVAWLDCYDLSPRVGDSFFDAIVHGRTNIDGQFDSVKGMNLAYEFLMQGDSSIRKRRKSEEQSLEKLRKNLWETKESLQAEVDDFRNNFSEWYSEAQQSEIERKEHCQTDFDTTMRQNSGDFLNAMSGWEAKIVNLENVFREKLRFDGPASYWKKQAYKYRCQGIIWVMAVLASVSLAVVYFRDLFLAWANGQRLHLSLSSLEGAVIFAAILSSFFFLTRVFSRLAFSSFHLQRDAEEREQLTHLYLSLGHEGQLDGESRQIVLQALFSRSETGLLASESGPTMPGLQEAISAAAKKN